MPRSAASMAVDTTTSTAYLGSGAISTYSGPYYFYVFPHSSTTPTKLVIKGTFTTKSGSTYTTYYPITVNNNITASGSNISSTVTYINNLKIRKVNETKSPPTQVKGLPENSKIANKITFIAKRLRKRAKSEV